MRVLVNSGSPIGLPRFVGQACCGMSFDWLTADRVQVAIYIAALVVAVVRLLVIWTIGWRSYSARGTIVVRLTSRGRELDDERQEFAVSCPAHGDAYHVPDAPEAMSYLGLGHPAVAPDNSGTRHWTDRVIDSERIGWTRWIGRNLKFALVRRFREPDIGTCPGC